MAQLGPLEQKFVQAIRKHALENYEKDGWDYVVETYSDEDILDEVDIYGTVADAIKDIGRMVKILDDRRKDVVAEIF